MTEKHNALIREEFTRQAATFSNLRSIANPENTQWILENLFLESHNHVLDVAAGTAAQSRLMAPHVRQVTAVDLTPAMLKQGRRETEETGISNIRFEQGLAGQLPHRDGSFDLTVNRFAIHHMLHPQDAVSEMARVTRTNGRVALIDLICPNDPTLANQYNALEQLRDPSHVAALTTDALSSLLKSVGLDIIHQATRKIDVVLNGWMDQTKTPADIREGIVASVKSELAGGPATGLQPFRQGDEIMFAHMWHIVIGTKRVA